MKKLFLLFTLASFALSGCGYMNKGLQELSNGGTLEDATMVLGIPNGKYPVGENSDVYWWGSSTQRSYYQPVTQGVTGFVGSTPISAQTTSYVLQTGTTMCEIKLLVNRPTHKIIQWQWRGNMNECMPYAVRLKQYAKNKRAVIDAQIEKIKKGEQGEAQSTLGGAFE